MNNTHNSPRHTTETNEAATQAATQAAAKHGEHGAVFLAAFDAATALLDTTHAVYDTEAYKADGIDPTEQARFEIEERGDDVVADALQERGIDVWGRDSDGDVWGNPDAYDAMVDGVAAACEAWQPQEPTPERVSLNADEASVLADLLDNAIDALHDERGEWERDGNDHEAALLDATIAERVALWERLTATPSDDTPTDGSPTPTTATETPESTTRSGSGSEDDGEPSLGLTAQQQADVERLFWDTLAAKSECWERDGAFEEALLVAGSHANTFYDDSNDADYEALNAWFQRLEDQASA